MNDKMYFFVVKDFELASVLILHCMLVILLSTQHLISGNKLN